MQYYGTAEVVEINAEYNETCRKSIFAQANTPSEVFEKLGHLALMHDAKLTKVQILPFL